MGFEQGFNGGFVDAVTAPTQADDGFATGTRTSAQQSATEVTAASGPRKALTASGITTSVTTEVV